MGLRIDDYNAKEHAASLMLDNEVISAFRPSFFAAVNYPAVITEEREVERYVDVMHEYDAVERHLTNSYSPDEVELLNAVCDLTAELTRNKFGRRIRPWVGPLSAIPLFRAVNALAPAAGGRPLTILEIGPGSGYLGALLYKAGHRYVSMDCTQALYFWQNVLFEHIGGTEFAEFADKDRVDWSESIRLAHLPWWHFVALPDLRPFTVDIVVCDRALSEMSDRAVCYIANAIRIITDQSTIGALLYEETGSTIHHSENDVRSWLAYGGLVERMARPIHAYLSAAQPYDILKALKDGLPAYNPSGKQRAVPGKEFIRFRPEEAPRGYHSARFMGFRQVAQPFDPERRPVNSAGGGSEKMEQIASRIADGSLRRSIVSIDDYDAREEQAKIDLSFEEIMAYSTRTFDYYGFPARVKVERELARYADWNRPSGTNQLYSPGRFLPGVCLQTDFTSDEAELINGVCDDTVAMTSAWIGRAVRPISNPLCHIGMFRVVTAFSRFYGRKLSVLEVGPGTGYLGVYLIKTGHRYAAMDNAQCFYLWQNRLFSYVAPGDFVDWASPLEAGNRPIRRVTHVPWWEFVRFSDDCPLDVDIVISNANLAEMAQDARKFLLVVGQQLLQKSDLGLFLFSEVGDQTKSSAEEVYSDFANYGYERLFASKFKAYAPKGRHPRARTASLEQEVPLYNPSGRDRVLAPADFLHLPPDQRPLDLRFTRVVEGWSPPVPAERLMQENR